MISQLKYQESGGNY